MIHLSRHYSSHSVTAITPVELSSSCRLALTLQQCTAAQFWQDACPTVQDCSAHQAHGSHSVTAITLVEICSSCRLAMTQQQCTAALVLTRCIHHISVLLCKTGSQLSFCHCQYTCGVLFFMHPCSDPAAMRGCASATTPMEICPPYRCAVTQHRCTATKFRAKCVLYCSVLLCTIGPQQGVSVQLHLRRSAIHTGVQ